jgi:hypothetical protein
MLAMVSPWPKGRGIFIRSIAMSHFKQVDMSRFARPKVIGAHGPIDVPLRTDVDAQTKIAFMRLARERKPDGKPSERTPAAYLRELVEREVRLSMIATMQRRATDLTTGNV